MTILLRKASAHFQALYFHHRANDQEREHAHALAELIIVVLKR
jgi:hypothetical protein